MAWPSSSARAHGGRFRRAVAFRSYRAAKKARYTSKKKPASTLVRALKSSMIRAAETKFVSAQYDLSFNSTITSAGECYPMCPAVPQGVDDYQRLGDKIRGKYLIIKGKLQYNNAYLDTAGTQFIPPATCRVMILSQNDVKSSGDVQTRVNIGRLLKDNVGTGTARSYGGGQYDNLAPINKDLFRVHLDRKIKLNWINHQIVLTDPGVSIAHNVGNDRTKYFYCKIPINRNMKFDDGNANFPNSFAPFMCFGSVCDDGAAPWSGSTPFHVTVTSTLYFTDA